MSNEKIKDYFTRYPHNDEVYENQGVLFHTRGAADSFGNAKDTVRHTRSKITTITQLNDNSVVQNPDNAVEVAKASAIQLLKTTDIETIEYNALKSIVKDLQLVTLNQKAETLRIALQEYKQKLNVE
jgi:phosphoribosylaminoimidazole carboxylase (NCAIR synthetase)